MHTALSALKLNIIPFKKFTAKSNFKGPDALDSEISNSSLGFCVMEKKEES
jgi:hypothetical protein